MEPYEELHARHIAGCPRAQTDAALYSSDELTPSAAREYRDHVRSCTHCAASIAEERELARLMAALPREGASSATLSSLSIAARAFVGQAAMRRSTAQQTWLGWLHRQILPHVASWTVPRSSGALGWACALLVALASAHMLVNGPQLRSGSASVPAQASLIADIEWDAMEEAALSTELGVLRENMNSLAVVIASDEP